MTQEQNSKFDMYERVIKCCNENGVKVALIPAFQADKNLLESKLPTIRRLSKLIDADKAHSDTKLNIRTKMIASGVDVCTNLYGYALMTANDEILKMSKHSKSSLNSGKEEEILSRCQNISEKARELVALLIEKRGMQEALLTQFEENIAQYQAIKPEPRSAQQAKSTLISQLNAIFDEAEIAMTLLSGSAVNFKNIDNHFLLRFEQATTIIASKTTKTQVKFNVVHSLTKEVISNYTIESSALKVNKTLADAKTMMPTLHHKGADFVLSKDGFETVVLNKVKIKRGKVNIVKIKMQPVESV